MIDSTVGAGEWLHEKHGGKPRRSWRKLHLAVDPDSGGILASELTTTDDGDASRVGPLLDQIDGPISAVFADGAYDGEPIYRSVAAHTPDAAVIIPPRSTAVPSDTAETAPTQRDRHIEMIEERGRLGWQRAVNYGKRSLAEVAMFRYKKVIGRGLHARTPPTQKTEAKIACKVINIISACRCPAGSPDCCGKGRNPPTSSFLHQSQQSLPLTADNPAIQDKPVRSGQGRAPSRGRYHHENTATSHSQGATSAETGGVLFRN